LVFSGTNCFYKIKYSPYRGAIMASVHHVKQQEYAISHPNLYKAGQVLNVALKAIGLVSTCYGAYGYLFDVSLLWGLSAPVVVLSGLGLLLISKIVSHILENLKKKKIEKTTLEPQVERPVETLAEPRSERPVTRENLRYYATMINMNLRSSSLFLSPRTIENINELISLLERSSLSQAVTLIDSLNRFKTRYIEANVPFSTSLVERRQFETDFARDKQEMIVEMTRINLARN
jgi:hypothetical protein